MTRTRALFLTLLIAVVLSLLLSPRHITREERWMQQGRDIPLPAR